jgi:hypothetical protein
VGKAADAWLYKPFGLGQLLTESIHFASEDMENMLPSQRRGI